MYIATQTIVTPYTLYSYSILFLAKDTGTVLNDTHQLLSAAINSGVSVTDQLTTKSLYSSE